MRFVVQRTRDWNRVPPTGRSTLRKAVEGTPYVGNEGLVGKVALEVRTDNQLLSRSSDRVKYEYALTQERSCSHSSGMRIPHDIIPTVTPKSGGLAMPAI